jgi:hypothetical protein
LELLPAPVLSVDEVLKDGSFRRVPVGVAADKPGGIVGWSQDLRLASDGRTFKIGLTMQRWSPQWPQGFRRWWRG